VPGTTPYPIDYTITLQQTRTTTQLRLYNLFSTTGNPCCCEWEVFDPPGPSLTVAANPGTQQAVFANDQGAGTAGIEAGSFTISSNALPGSLMTGIDITASGTGDDSTAYTDIYIYRDDAGGTNPGAYDPGDVAIAGPELFATDDGTINFTVLTAEQSFPASVTRTYFVVVRLSGTANAGQTFQYTVSDIVVAAGLKSVPSAATMSTLLTMTKPAAEAARPEKLLRKEITTGMSPPPIGMTPSTPSARDRAMTT
jgi:hypothetical protein